MASKEKEKEPLLTKEEEEHEKKVRNVHMITIRKEMLRLMNSDDDWYKNEDSLLFKKIQLLAKQLENDAKPRKKKGDGNDDDEDGKKSKRKKDSSSKAE
ncbi:hypothetical protein [Enterococcus timonensis]|uniref:hypothetical protein n=1 Tax=Enterococcus timonensis TaxID=1852364 RepID=UPI0008DAB1C0|nr:hypothetical protein [Enterococcus timonensis]